MIEKSPDEIYVLFKYWSCVKLSFKEDIIWFMWLYSYGNIYEAWSLCIWKEFRNLGLGTVLQKLILEKFCEVPIFLITNVEHVKSISQHVGLLEVPRKMVTDELLAIIEQWGKLLTDDALYYNKKLYFNKLWYHLNTQIWNQ